MIDAAIKALQQMFSPPFRSVLIKSILLALVMIVLIGVGLHKGLTWLTAERLDLGGRRAWARARMIRSPGSSGSSRSRASLGIVVGGVFLMPAVTAFVGSFFVDEIAEQVEREHYPADPAGKALPLVRAVTEGLQDRADLDRWFISCALPFILFAGLGLFILFFASAYLLSREYFELAAMRFRPVAEAKAFRKANQTHACSRPALLIAAFVSIPIVNLATPLFAMALMVHMHKKLSQRALIEARADRRYHAACRASRHRLPRPVAEIRDHAFFAERLAREARIAPVQDQPVMRMHHVFGRDHLDQRNSTSSGFFPIASPVRLPTRNTCVSTAMVGSPNAILSTTFAVLRPTPGSASSASRVRGTSLPCSAISFSDSEMTFFALSR